MPNYRNLFPIPCVHCLAVTHWKRKEGEKKEVPGWKRNQPQSSATTITANKHKLSIECGKNRKTSKQTSGIDSDTKTTQEKNKNDDWRQSARQAQREEKKSGQQLSNWQTRTHNTHICSKWKPEEEEESHNTLNCSRSLPANKQIAARSKWNEDGCASVNVNGTRQQSAKSVSKASKKLKKLSTAVFHSFFSNFLNDKKEEREKFN